MKILKSIELREDNVNEVLQFTNGWGKIDPTDGKFKLKDYAGATVTVGIGDHIGLLHNSELESGYHLLGFAPNLEPSSPVNQKSTWRETLYENQEYYKTAVNDLVALCAGIAKEAGWDEKQREMGTKLMLVVSEVSEAMEGDRKGLMDDHLPHRPMVEVELADTNIRVFHIAGEQGMDLGGAMIEKLIYNTKREDHKLENRAKENGKKY